MKLKLKGYKEDEIEKDIFFAIMLASSWILSVDQKEDFKCGSKGRFFMLRDF